MNTYSVSLRISFLLALVLAPCFAALSKAEKMPDNAAQVYQKYGNSSAEDEVNPFSTEMENDSLMSQDAGYQEFTRYRRMKSFNNAEVDKKNGIDGAGRADKFLNYWDHNFDGMPDDSSGNSSTNNLIEETINKCASRPLFFKQDGKTPLPFTSLTETGGNGAYSTTYEFIEGGNLKVTRQEPLFLQHDSGTFVKLDKVSLNHAKFIYNFRLAHEAHGEGNDLTVSHLQKMLKKDERVTKAFAEMSTQYMVQLIIDAVKARNPKKYKNRADVEKYIDQVIDEREKTNPDGDSAAKDNPKITTCTFDGKEQTCVRLSSPESKQVLLIPQRYFQMQVPTEYLYDEMIFLTQAFQQNITARMLYETLHRLVSEAIKQQEKEEQIKITLTPELANSATAKLLRALLQSVIPFNKEKHKSIQWDQAGSRKVSLHEFINEQSKTNPLLLKWYHSALVKPEKDPCLKAQESGCILDSGVLRLAQGGNELGNYANWSELDARAENKMMQDPLSEQGLSFFSDYDDETLGEMKRRKKVIAQDVENYNKSIDVLHQAQADRFNDNNVNSNIHYTVDDFKEVQSKLVAAPNKGLSYQQMLSAAIKNGANKLWRSKTYTDAEIEQFDGESSKLPQSSFDEMMSKNAQNINYAEDMNQKALSNVKAAQ